MWKEPKFTKGDWHITGNTGHISNGYIVIAQVYGAHPVAGELQWESSECEANAHLIKASKKMYEALRCALAALEADQDSTVAAEMFGGEADPDKAQTVNRFDVTVLAKEALLYAEGNT